MPNRNDQKLQLLVTIVTIAIFDEGEKDQNTSWLIDIKLFIDKVKLQAIWIEYMVNKIGLLKTVALIC